MHYADEMLCLYAQDVYMLRHTHPLKQPASTLKECLGRALAQATRHAVAPENPAAALWKDLETRLNEAIEVTRPSETAIDDQWILNVWSRLMAAIQSIQDDFDAAYSESHTGRPT